MSSFLKSTDDGFNWSHYFSYLAELEQSPPPEGVDTIESRTRDAIRGVGFCDVTVPKVFSMTSSRAASVIVASLVFDVVALVGSPVRPRVNTESMELAFHKLEIVIEA